MDSTRIEEGTQGTNRFYLFIQISKMETGILKLLGYEPMIVYNGIDQG